MELLVTGGLLGLGYLLTEDVETKDDKKKFMAKVPLSKKPNGDSIYQSNRSYDIFQSEWKNSGPLYKNSFDTKNTNVVFDGPPKSYANTPSGGQAKLLNKVDYADKTLPVEFNTFMTYEDALLDVQGIQTNANQDNNRMKNNMSRPESGGEIGISLTGEPIDPVRFTHNNMQPFFGGNLTQNVDEYATRGIFENFTGEQDSYQNKKEQGLFFDPQKNVTNVYGASNLSGYQMDRYYVSNVRSNETPVEKQYIAPNLNDGYGNSGGGFIKGNGGTQSIEYALPKTTDEMRVKTKPKISYYGRIVSGAHIAKPGKVGTLYKNRPDTFWVETPDRYFTTVGAVEAPAARACQVLKYTNRKTTELKTRVNSAAPVHGSKGVVRGKYKISDKITYENDGPRNATVEGQWSIMGMLGLDKTPNDYGKKSIRMRPNARTESGSKTAVLNLHSNVSKGEARNGQKAKKTMKEVTEENNNNGNIGMVQPGRGVVYDPNDVARTTMKETNIHNNHAGMMTTIEQSRGAVYDPEEYEFRTTNKELFENNNHSGNMGPREKRSYVESQDEARRTMKESTMVGDVMGVASGMERNDGYLVKEVNVPATHRDTTSISYMTNANKNTHGGYEVTEVQSVGTNRMFSVEYTGNSGNTANTSNPMSYQDAYNATMKSVRDFQDEGFTPGAQAPSMGIDPQMVHATTHRTGDIQNQYLTERGVIPSTMTNSIPQMSECNLTSEKNTLPNEPLADRINPVILDAFKQNPYSQSLSSWA